MSVSEFRAVEAQAGGPDMFAEPEVTHDDERPFGVALLLGAAFALMLVWAAVVPFDRGPDEAEHYRIAHFIYSNGRLPVFAADGDIYGYVVNENEAYISYASTPGGGYILAAAAMRLVPGGHPYFLLYAARLVSTVAVLLTIYLAYRIVRLVFPNRPDLARGAALMLALIPQVSLTGAYVNHDAYTMAACSWAVYLLLAGWKQGWTLRRAAWLGVALGLVLLGRLTGYVVVPFALLVAAISLRGGLGFIAGRLFVTGAVTALVSGWWFVRSYLHTGDPIGLWANLEAWRTLAPIRRAPSELGISFLDFLFGDKPVTIFRTFWAVFGQLEVYFLWPYYVLLALLTLGAGAGLAWGLAQWLAHARQPRVALQRAIAREDSFHSLAVVMLGVLALGMVALILWQTWVTSFATQGRYLYPAIVPFALFLTLGIAQFPVGRALRPLATASVFAFLFVLNMIGLFSYTVPTYYL